MIPDHPRMNTAEVCALARYTPATLWRRIREGHMPKAIDRGSGGYLFDRTAVESALGMKKPQPESERTDWDFDPAALREEIARRVARDRGARWRERQTKKVLPGA